MVQTECSTGFLEGFPSSAEELSRGLVGIMPHGQTRECTRGWTCGIKLLQCPLQHVQLCPDRGGWAETIIWSLPSVGETRVNWLQEGYSCRGVLSSDLSLWGALPDDCLLEFLGFWFPINMGPQTFWDSFGRFLFPRFSFLSPLSPLHSTSSYCFPVASSFIFTVTFTFCLTISPVVVHLPGGLAIFPSFGLGNLIFCQRGFFWVLVRLCFLILNFYFICHI